ncbi:MAG: NUDIX hydrolase [Puniceicoccales bacterium]|jgi:8-oxo-dGTP pyrophosphatase MutT (NUDIX family)|nr:NUDIX hydrolase [Puniceicoccales bacterium]
MSKNFETKLSEWRKLSEEKLVDYKIFSIYRCRFENVTQRKAGDFFLVECDDCVQVIAETTDGRIVMVEQYRFGLESFSLELPGGRMDAGEKAIEAGRRELEEETGFCGGEAEVIAELYPNPAMQTNVVNVVLIRGCRKELDTHFDEFEDLATSLITREELVNIVRSGRLSNCITMASIMRYILREQDHWR